MTRIAIAAVIGVLVTAVGRSYADEKPGAPSQFKITMKRDSDTVEVKVDQEKTVFSIQSPVGISEAVMERTGDKWPDAVLLRLYLKGLESFRATSGTVTLDAAVSSQGGTVRIWKDGKEDSPLDSTSPFWMDVRMVGGDGKPATVVPLKDGYFEIQLPKALFEGNPKSITVNWIDFYRN